MRKLKSDGEKVVVGNWIANVQTKVDSTNAGVRRKVLTKGISVFDLRDVMPDIVEVLRQGNEVRFSDGGEEVLRLYPCLDKDLTRMFVAAQTMGEFRQSIADITFNIVRRDGKDNDDMREVRRQMVQERESHARSEVTPDPLVTCPKCGCEFRVGRSQAR